MPLSATDAVLARLVSAGGFLPAAELEAAVAKAGAEGTPLRDVLVACGVAPAVLASLETAARSSAASRTAPASSAATLVGRPPESDSATIVSSREGGPPASTPT